MTDNDIIKALEWYVSKFKTVGFVYMDADGTHLIGTQDVLDLINRQKAEIERLQLEKADIQRDLQIVLDNSLSVKYPTRVSCEKGMILTKSLEEYDKLIGDIGAEAIREFAERLKKHSYFDHKDQRKVVAEAIIDHYLKEKVGDIE